MQALTFRWTRSLAALLLIGSSSAIAPAALAAPAPTPAPLLLAQERNASSLDLMPLPGDVSSVQKLPTPGEDGSINFQTSLSVSDAIAFYRSAFASLGLVEREINTAITPQTFSMIFDGSGRGLPLVIQGTTLGPTTNINIRFEDV